MNGFNRNIGLQRLEPPPCEVNVIIHISILYHIVSALRQVGLEAEARMIAAEALTRL